MKKVVAIIQARMNSTRLPGKVLLDIQYYPMLYHVVERLRRAKHVSQIVIATTDQESDKPIIAYARELGIDVFWGNETDVLARYWGAAQMAKADFILRITADCPLLDPMFIDDLIIYHFDNDADYSSNVMRRTCPRGLDAEIFSIDTLRQTYNLSFQPQHREHVTAFIYENPRLFRLMNFDMTGELRRPDLRLCVDTEADIQLLREIYRRYYVPGEIIDVRTVIRWLDTEPYWKSINMDSEQDHLNRNTLEGIQQVKLMDRNKEGVGQIGDR